MSPTPDPDPCGKAPYDGPWSLAPLLPGSAVRVSVAELNLRGGPCVSAEPLTTLKKGKVVIVGDGLFGPVESDGYPWYFVQPAPNSYPFGTLPPLPGSVFPDGIDTSGGWIAANDGSSAYVTPLASRCPTTVDLENVVAMLPAERLACLDGPIVLVGTYGCGGCGGEGGPTSEPRWLGDTFEFEQIRVRWTAEHDYRPVGVHFKPTGPAAPPDGAIVRMTVHVDDPAAQSCSFVWTIETPAFHVPDEIAVAWCRERLVVDSYEVIGTDPNYMG